MPDHLEETLGSGTSTPLQNNFVTSERLRGGGSSGREEAMPGILGMTSW